MKNLSRVLIFVALVVASLSFANHFSSASTIGVNEYKVGPLGVTWAQTAAVCPQDGVTPCQGILAGTDVTGWIWQTEQQVRDLVDDYIPELSFANSLGGPAYFVQAAMIIGIWGPTKYISSTYQYTEWMYGWTSNTNSVFNAYWEQPAFNSGIGFGVIQDIAEPTRGPLLWRPVGSATTTTTTTTTVPSTTTTVAPTTTTISPTTTVTPSTTTVVQPATTTTVPSSKGRGRCRKIC